jgi:hypothetical protein
MPLEPLILIDAFRANGGWIDTDIMGIQQFPLMGSGVVALQDIKVERHGSVLLPN